MEYPKIQSLYKRDGIIVDPITGDRTFDNTKTRHLIMGEYSIPEFELVKRWQVFEKIDGTNIRVSLRKEKDGNVAYGIKGRTEAAIIPPHLFNYLNETFSIDKIMDCFPDAYHVVIFGEGYGPKIQSGARYRKEVSFICFDVYINGWWLKYEDRLGVCDKLKIDHVPLIGEMSEKQIVDYVASHPKSLVSQDKELVMEGVVCVTNPILAVRSGQVLKFKLRCEDVPQQKYELAS